MEKYKSRYRKSDTRHFKEEKVDIVSRKSAEKPPIPLSEMHKYVFYGGKPIKRNSSF